MLQYLLNPNMSGQAKVSHFIKKLCSIVQNESYQSAISWNDQEIIIRDTTALVKDILPRYFRHSKLESFIRQLNLYGFKKVSKPCSKDCLFFKHDFFKPDQKELLSHIQLKSKFKRQEQKKQDKVSEQPDIRLLTKSREEELTQTRITFQNTMQRIYALVSNLRASNPNLDAFLKESLMMLKLSGVQQANENKPIQEAPSITHFFSRMSIQLQ